MKSANRFGQPDTAEQLPGKYLVDKIENVGDLDKLFIGECRGNALIRDFRIRGRIYWIFTASFYHAKIPPLKVYSYKDNLL
jgi:hypothetical protein